MELPTFLQLEDGGYIRLTGHRIGLHHVVRLYDEGHSAEAIAAHFPTLSLAHIHKVIAFFLENEEEVKAYVAAHDQEMERQMAAAPPTPTLRDLRARLEARRRAETQPVPPPAGQ